MELIKRCKDLPHPQESLEITFHRKAYLPKVGANVSIMRNEKRGEEYERKAYIYIVPNVRMAMSSALDLEQHIVVDVYRLANPDYQQGQSEA